MQTASSLGRCDARRRAGRGRAAALMAAPAPGRSPTTSSHVRQLVNSRQLSNGRARALQLATQHAQQAPPAANKARAPSRATHSAPTMQAAMQGVMASSGTAVGSRWVRGSRWRAMAGGPPGPAIVRASSPWPHHPLLQGLLLCGQPGDRGLCSLAASQQRPRAARGAWGGHWEALGGQPAGALWLTAPRGAPPAASGGSLALRRPPPCRWPTTLAPALSRCPAPVAALLQVVAAKGKQRMRTGGNTRMAQMSQQQMVRASSGGGGGGLCDAASKRHQSGLGSVRSWLCSVAWPPFVAHLAAHSSPPPLTAAAALRCRPLLWRARRRPPRRLWTPRTRSLSSSCGPRRCGEGRGAELLARQHRVSAVALLAGGSTRA